MRSEGEMAHTLATLRDSFGVDIARLLACTARNWRHGWSASRTRFSSASTPNCGHNAKPSKHVIALFEVPRVRHYRVVTHRPNPALARLCGQFCLVMT